MTYNGLKILIIRLCMPFSLDYYLLNYVPALLENGSCRSFNESNNLINQLDISLFTKLL